MRVKRFFAACLLAFLVGPAMADPSPRPITWALMNEIYVSTLQVRAWGPDTLADPQPWTGVYVRVNVSDPYPDPALVPGTWYIVDLAPFGVAADAKAAFLSGLLIITHGTTPETADLHITFARPDDAVANCSKYIGQAIEPFVGGGQRSNMATWVPLVGGKFKFCFNTATGGTSPANSAYAVNLTLQAWGRFNPATAGDPFPGTFTISRP